MQEIGADERQRLDIVPAQYRVIVTRRPNIISRACTGTVVQAAAPERLQGRSAADRTARGPCAGLLPMRSPRGRSGTDCTDLVINSKPFLRLN